MFLYPKSKIRYNTVALASFTFLLKKFIKKSQYNFPEFVFKSESSSCLELIYILKNHSLFKVDYLNDIVVTDYLNLLPNKRFSVSYVLTSIRLNSKYRVTVRVPETISLCSLSILFKNSLWLEREA